jgi:hypothetical protein
MYSWENKACQCNDCNSEWPRVVACHKDTVCQHVVSYKNTYIVLFNLKNETTHLSNKKELQAHGVIFWTCLHAIWALYER